MMREEKLISSKHLDGLHARHKIQRYLIPTGGDHSPYIQVSYRRLRAWLKENPARWGFVDIDPDLFAGTTALIKCLHCPHGRSTC